jgi:hypothetical protein
MDVRRERWRFRAGGGEAGKAAAAAAAAAAIARRRRRLSLERRKDGRARAQHNNPSQSIIITFSQTRVQQPSGGSRSAPTITRNTLSPLLLPPSAMVPHPPHHAMDSDEFEEEDEDETYTDEDEDEDDSFDEDEDDSSFGEGSSAETGTSDDGGDTSDDSSSSSSSSESSEWEWEEGDMRGRSWADLPAHAWEVIAGKAVEAYSYDDETDQDAFTNTLAVVAADDGLLLSLFSDGGAALDAADLDSAHCKVVRRGRVERRPLAQSPPHKALRCVCRALRATMDDRVAGLAIAGARRHVPPPPMAAFAFSGFARLRRLDVTALAGAASPVPGVKGAEASTRALLGALTALAALRDLLVPGELFAGESVGGVGGGEQEADGGGGGGGGAAAMAADGGAAAPSPRCRTCSLEHLPCLPHLTRLEVRCTGPHGHEPLAADPARLLPTKFPALRALALEAMPLPVGQAAADLRLPRGLRSLSLGGTRWDGTRPAVPWSAFLVVSAPSSDGEGGVGDGDNEPPEEVAATAAALEQSWPRAGGDAKQPKTGPSRPSSAGRGGGSTTSGTAGTDASGLAAPLVPLPPPAGVPPPHLESLSLGPCVCDTAALAAIAQLPALRHLALHDVRAADAASPPPEAVGARSLAEAAAAQAAAAAPASSSRAAADLLQGGALAAALRAAAASAPGARLPQARRRPRASANTTTTVWPALETLDWELSHPGDDTLLPALDLSLVKRTLKGLKVSLSALTRPALDGTYHSEGDARQQQLDESLCATLERVSELTLLTRLELALAGHSSFPRALQGVSRLCELEVLDLSGNSFVLNDFPPGIQGAFPKLRRFLCYNNDLPPDGALELLEALCGVDGSGERLRSIDLNDAPDVAALPPLADWCPRLSMLSVSDCHNLGQLCPAEYETYEEGMARRVALDVSRSALPRRLRALFFRNGYVPRDPCRALRADGVHVSGGGPSNRVGGQYGDADEDLPEDAEGPGFDSDDEDPHDDDDDPDGGDGSDTSLMSEDDAMALRRAEACGLIDEAAEAAAEVGGGEGGSGSDPDEEWWAKPGNPPRGRYGAYGGGYAAVDDDDSDEDDDDAENKRRRRPKARLVHECPDPDGVALRALRRRQQKKAGRCRHGHGHHSDEEDEEDGSNRDGESSGSGSEHDHDHDHDDHDDDGGDDGPPAGGGGAAAASTNARVPALAGGYYRRRRSTAGPIVWARDGDVPSQHRAGRRYFRHAPLPPGLLYASLGDGTRLRRPLRTLSAWLGGGAGPRFLRSLDLTSMGLRHLPDCLAHLAPTLRTLALAQNNFDGPLPRVVGKLWALRDLAAGDCPRLNDVSDAVAKLPYLTSLGLARLPGLTSIPRLGRTCPRLRILDLTGSGSAGGGADAQGGGGGGEGLELGRSVGRLTDLRMLCLRGCRGLRLPRSMRGCVALEHLDVSETGTQSPLTKAQLALPALKFLALDSDAISGPPQTVTLSKLTSLRKLQLRGWTEGGASDQDHPAPEGALRVAGAGGRVRALRPSSAGAGAGCGGAGAGGAGGEGTQLLDRSAQRVRERAARWVPLVAVLAGLTDDRSPALPPGCRPGVAVAPELEVVVAPEPIVRALRASGVAARAARKGVDIACEQIDMQEHVTQEIAD